MTVFKTFIKVLLKNKAMLILYTVMLVGFAMINFTSNSGLIDFSSTKPKIVVVNNDSSKIAKSLYDYMNENTIIKEVSNQDDALFYRDISYVIEIPKDYGDNFLKGNNPNIIVKSNGDYNASLASMLLDKYLKTANTYLLANYSEEEICNKTSQTLKENIDVTLTSKLDTKALSNTGFYFSFLSYSLLAGCVFTIALSLSSFKDAKIKKRTLISSTKNYVYNKSLFLGSCLFGILLWLIYMIVSVILLKNTMFSINGLLYIINSFVFLICCLAIAFLIGNVVSNKEAIGGIVNVVALGSSFLCGAFLPIDYIPSSVLLVSRFIPTYWYIQNNELISKMEVFNLDTLMPLINNCLVVIIFIVVFITITNIISKRKIN